MMNLSRSKIPPAQLKVSISTLQTANSSITSISRCSTLPFFREDSLPTGYDSLEMEEPLFQTWTKVGMFRLFSWKVEFLFSSLSDASLAARALFLGRSVPTF